MDEHYIVCILELITALCFNNTLYRDELCKLKLTNHILSAYNKFYNPTDFVLIKTLLSTLSNVVSDNFSYSITDLLDTLSKLLQIENDSILEKCLILLTNILNIDKVDIDLLSSYINPKQLMKWLRDKEPYIQEHVVIVISLFFNLSNKIISYFDELKLAKIIVSLNDEVLKNQIHNILHILINLIRENNTCKLSFENSFLRKLITFSTNEIPRKLFGLFLTKYTSNLLYEETVKLFNDGIFLTLYDYLRVGEKYAVKMTKQIFNKIKELIYRQEFDQSFQTFEDKIKSEIKRQNFEEVEENMEFFIPDYKLFFINEQSNY